MDGTSHGPALRASAENALLELTRLAISPRALRMAIVIYLETLPHGRQKLRIRKLECLGQPLGLSRSHTRDALVELQQSGIVQINGKEIVVLPDIRHWTAKEKVGRHAFQGLLRDLEHFNSIEQHSLPTLEPEPSLDDALAEVSIEGATRSQNRERSRFREQISATPYIPLKDYRKSQSITLSSTGGGLLLQVRQAIGEAAWGQWENGWRAAVEDSPDAVSFGLEALEMESRRSAPANPGGWLWKKVLTAGHQPRGER